MPLVFGFQWWFLGFSKLFLEFSMPFGVWLDVLGDVLRTCWEDGDFWLISGVFNDGFLGFPSGF